jgi:hypothetical protein
MSLEASRSRHGKAGSISSQYGFQIQVADNALFHLQAIPQQRLTAAQNGQGFLNIPKMPEERPPLPPADGLRRFW